MSAGRHTWRSPLVEQIAAVAELVGAVMFAGRRSIDPELLARARRGDLTRSNTAKGTPERQAVDRNTYVRRRAFRPHLTARQAAGHPAPDDRLPRISLMLADPPRWVIIESPNRRDVSRAGAYENLVGDLERGMISSDAFRRRVSSWRPISGNRFLSDPDAVLAIIEDRRAGDQELFYYDAGRST